MIAVYTYQQLRDRLLKYKKQYEEEIDITIPMHKNDELIAKGHLRMIDILLDDLDSESGIAWLGADFADSEPKPYKRKICEGNCEKCSIAKQFKSYYLIVNDSVFDATSDYNDFIENCKKENNVDS